MNTNTHAGSGTGETRTYIVGREGHIYLGDDSISRQHAEITVVGNKIRLRDLNSTNGIFLVNGKQIDRIQDEFIELDQPIMLGAIQCTVKDLLDGLQRTKTS